MRILEMLIGLVLMFIGILSLFLIYFAETNQLLWAVAALTLIPLGSWFTLED